MDANSLINEIRGYSAASNLMPSTICQRAFKNPKYLERLEARAARLAAEVARWQAWVAANPPAAPACYACGRVHRAARHGQDVAPSIDDGGDPTADPIGADPPPDDCPA